MTTQSEQQSPPQGKAAKPRMSLHGSKADVMPPAVAERIAARDRRLRALDGWSSEPLERAVDDFNGAKDGHTDANQDGGNAVASAEGEKRAEGHLEASGGNAPLNTQSGAEEQPENQAPATVGAAPVAIAPQLNPAGEAAELVTSTAPASAQEPASPADGEEDEDEDTAPQRGRPRLRPLPELVKLTAEGDKIFKAMTIDLPLNVHEKLNWLAGTTFGMNKKSILLSLLEPQLDAMLREQGYKVPSFKAKK